MASILFGGAVTLSLATRAIRKQTRERLSSVPKASFWTSENGKRKRADFYKAGREKLIVIADFDRTLTSFATNGVKTYASHEVLEKCGLLGADYHARALAIKNKYGPKEYDMNLSDEERLRVCEQWWNQAHELLIDYNLQRAHVVAAVEAAIANKRINLRPGARAFMETLQRADVPVIVFSAGLADVIEVFLQKQNLLFLNVHVVGNKMRFDGDGRLVGFESAIIHSMNKGVQSIGAELSDHLAGRCNILVLGDSIGDAHMADALDNDASVLKHGFLNDEVQQRLSRYQSEFDELDLGDGSFDSVSALVGRICMN